MKELNHFISSTIHENLSDSERIYLKKILSNYQGFPSLKELWSLMDQSWDKIGCNPLKMDHKITEFYRDPVWLLNGLFIEQDQQSINYRYAYMNWVKSKKPKRIADFGGGFGSLARLIGERMPQTKVEIVEPYPHPAAIALTSNRSNVEFVPQLSGKYDLIIATDVFEHVTDPIKIAFDTGSYLQIGGNYLIANCFAPVIKCHLPQLFHFHICWKEIMREMGFRPEECVEYGRSYKRLGDINETSARNLEALAKSIYPFINLLPKGKSLIGNNIFNFLRYWIT